jgi:colanic acid biosynthesis glycosyl transferase WcaI
MKVLIVTQYFWPESFRINDLAIGLAERGHDVTVLTGLPNYPEGRLFAGYGARGPWRERHRGIEIVRVPIVPRGRGGRLRLGLNYVSFALSASLFGALRVRNAVDAVLVYEPSPVTVGIPGALMRWLKAAPVLFWVQDLWPESLRATGAVRSRWILAAVGRLVRWIYARSDYVLVQSRAFVGAVASAGVPAERIRYFPNSAERSEGGAARAAPLPEGFRILFAGNIGAAQDFVTILRAAELARAEARLRWIIVGDGRQRAWVEREIARRGLQDTVCLLGRHPPEAMPAFYAAADALLVTLRRDPIFALTVPSKLQSYLAAGKPILAALDGEGAAILAEAEAGLVAPSERPEALAEQAIRLSRTPPAERARMGESGRRYFARHFERERLLDQLEGWLGEAVAAAAAS